MTTCRMPGSVLSVNSLVLVKTLKVRHYCCFHFGEKKAENREVSHLSKDIQLVAEPEFDLRQFLESQ